MRRPAVLRAVFYLGPLLLWCGLVWMLGLRYGSFTASHRLFSATLDALFVAPLPGDETFVMEQTLLLRRLASLGLYGVLTLLLVRALQWGRERLRWYSAVAGVLLALGSAWLDSWHKDSVPGRHGGGGDVLLSATGIALFLGGTLLFFGVKALERRLLRTPPVRGTPADADMWIERDKTMVCAKCKAANEGSEKFCGGCDS